MASLWNAFLEDYADEIFNWPLRFILEAFWHYCQDGSREVAELHKRKAKQVPPIERAANSFYKDKEVKP